MAKTSKSFTHLLFEDFSQNRIDTIVNFVVLLTSYPEIGDSKFKGAL